jgi:hypothetical protein
MISLVINAVVSGAPSFMIFSLTFGAAVKISILRSKQIANGSNNHKSESEESCSTTAFLQYKYKNVAKLASRQAVTPTKQMRKSSNLIVHGNKGARKI